MPWMRCRRLQRRSLLLLLRGAARKSLRMVRHTDHPSGRLFLLAMRGSGCPAGEKVRKQSNFFLRSLRGDLV
jgi:hypothetical protein